MYSVPEQHPTRHIPSQPEHNETESEKAGELWSGCIWNTDRLCLHICLVIHSKRGRDLPSRPQFWPSALPRLETVCCLEAGHLSGPASSTSSPTPSSCTWWAPAWLSSPPTGPLSSSSQSWSDQSYQSDLSQCSLQDVLKPPAVYQYKSQPPLSQTPLTRARLGSCLQYAVVFQTVTSLLGNILLWRFRYQWINIVSPIQELPSLSGYFQSSISITEKLYNLNLRQTKC